MPLYVNNYEPSISKDQLNEQLLNLYSIMSYEIDLLRVQLDHNQYSEMVTATIELKRFAQEAYNIDLNMKELEKENEHQANGN